MVTLLMLSPLALGLAWINRLNVLSFAARVGGGLDMTAADLKMDWQHSASRLENVSLSLANLTVYSPREQIAMLSIKDLSIHLHRSTGEAASFSFIGTAMAHDLEFNFIAYDALLSDTNVRRLVYALGGDEAAADSVADGSETTLPSSPGVTPSSSSVEQTFALAGSVAVTFDRVELRRVAINPSIRPSIRAGTPRVVLPPVTLLDETLPAVMLEAGLSMGLLNWLSALVVRTLASTSIDTAASTLDGGVGLLANAIGRAMDLVDQTNALTRLPGSSVLAGATLGTRRLVLGVNAAASAVLGGMSGGAKEVVGSKPTPAGVLRGVERGVGALQAGLRAGTVAALEGVDGGAASLVDGVESFANLEALGFLPGVGLLSSAVHGAAGAARGGVRAATAGAASIAGGVLEGGASAIGGAAGGLSHVVGGVADGTMHTFEGLLRGGRSLVSGVSDGVVGVAQSAVKGDGAGVAQGGQRLLDSVLSGGGQALGGLVSGGEQIVEGTVRGLSYFGKGVVGGAEAVVAGVLEPTEQAAREVSGLWWQQASSRPETCTSHRVHLPVQGTSGSGGAGTLLARLGLRKHRGGKRQELVVVCTPG